jgi:integrase
MARTPNGASSIYLGKDGYWHGRVTVGVRDDGRPDRRHVMGTRADVTRKVRALEKERDGGSVRRAGRTWTVEQWLTYWVENIAAPFVRENTIAGYRVAVSVHLVPGLGKHRLDRLEPEHLEKLYVWMMKNGSAPATAHQAHRTIRTALNEAVRRGHLARNPAALAKAPRLPETEVEPYSVDEIRLLLQSALEGRNGARWAVALALGLRQGEALGLQWNDVDLDAGTLLVRRGRLRPRWDHGCNGTCGRKFGGYCPNRVALRDETAETKSRAGRRRVGLPGQLVELLRTHRAEQDRERARAAQLWTDGGWGVREPDRRTLEPAHGLDGLEEAPHPGRCPRRSAPRRPAHRGHRAAPARRSRASSHGRDGLVEHGHGGAVPAHHRHGSARHRRTCRQPDLAGRRRARGRQMRLELRLDGERRVDPLGSSRRCAWSSWR